MVQVYLESTATDESGNAVYDYDGHFSMAAAGGDGAGTRPWVTGSFPANGTDDVNALVPALTLRFSEPMDAGTTGGSVVLYDVDAGDAEVAVDISFDASSELMTVTPQAPLNAGGSYQLALTTELRDTDGDALQYIYPIYFRLLPTAVDDDRQPMVVALSPAPGSTGVGVNARYSVRYDEPMNPTRFDTDGGERFNAQFSEDNKVLRYERTDTLEPETAYVEAVPTLGDYAGNPAVAAEASFETGSGPDLTVPTQTANTITTTMPLAPVLAFQYSEPLDPVSVSESGVGLYSVTDGAPVDATLLLEDDNQRLVIIPGGPLKVGHFYRVSLYSLRDLSGNSFSHSEYFTTNFDADVTDPTVLAATVSDGQVDVPTNPRLTVAFSDVVNRETLGAVVLRDSLGDEVQTDLTWNGSAITLVPIKLLEASSSYTLTVDAVEDQSGNVLASPWIATFETAASADVREGSVIRWAIPNQSKDIPLDAVLSVELSERVDPTSVNEDSFYLHNSTAGRRVPGTSVLSADGLTLRFVPDALLIARHQYVLYVSHGDQLRDLAGNRVGNNYGYRHFTAGDFVDDVSPAVSGVSVAEGAANVPLNGRVVIALTEPLGGMCLPGDVVRVSAAGVPVPVDVSLSSSRLELTVTVVAGELEALTSYDVELVDACDYAGNLFSGSVLSFTTTDVADTTGPSLVSIDPEHYATDVPVDALLTVTFDEPIDRLSRPPLTGAGVTVQGTYTVTGNVLTFQPSAPLKGSTQYGWSFYNTAWDYSGNQAGWWSRSFTTADAEDMTAPEVTAISPVADAIDVSPRSTPVRVSFSEPMNLGSLTSNAMAFYANAEVIRPQVFRSSDGQQVTLTAHLPASSMVSVILTEDVTDLSGNALPPYVSSFMTGPADDTDSGRPRVVRQVPSSGSSDWSGVDEVVLYTTEPMDPASIAAAFHVAESGVLVDGTLELLGDGRTIRFQTPTAFEVGALVQVYLESTATDESGNAVYDYDGHFSMAAAGGDGAGTRPWVTGSFPANGTDDVNALVPALTLRFSEPMDAGTTGGSVVLYDVDAGDAEVAVDISFDASGELMTVTPQAPLNAGGSYQLALTTELRDTDGDSLWYAYPIHFSLLPTAVDDDRQPMVVALSPAPGSTGVGVNARYSVRYDEPMNPTRFDTDGGERFNAQFSEDNKVLRYERTDTLEPETAYVEAVPTLGDYAGNPAVAAEASFETGSGPDLTVPTQTANTITTTMPLAPVLAFQYSEPLDPVSVSESGVGLYSVTDGAPVDATALLVDDNQRVVIIPGGPLKVGHFYRVSLYSLRDLSGNSFSHSEYFTTNFDADVTDPTVLAATVSDGQVDVPTNPRLTVAFSDVVNRETLGAVVLRDSLGDEVQTDLTWNGSVITLVPIKLLEASSSYTLTVNAVEDQSGNVLASPWIATFETAASADVQEGSIEEWSFPSNGKDIPLNAVLSVELSERVDPTSVNEDSFYLHNSTAGRRVPGTSVLSADGLTLRFVPDALLIARHQYVLQVSHGDQLRDLAGNRVGNNYGYRYFTAGDFVDDVSPAVSGVSVAEGAANVPLNGRVVIALTEPLGGMCLPGDVVRVSAAGVPVPVDVSLSSSRLELTVTVVAGELEALTSYDVELVDACDYAGNLFSGSVLSFTTTDVADTTGPSLVSIDPEHYATDVPVDALLTVTFDEPIDRLSRPPLTGAGVTVQGTYTVTGNVLTFQPSAPLKGSTQYGWSFYNTAWDYSGNQAGWWSRSFTTADAEDMTAPEVTAISPVADAIDVSPRSTPVRVSFSEPMNLGSLTSNAMAFYANAEVIRPQVFRSSDGQQVTLTAHLPASSMVSVILTEDVTDLSGNALPPYVSSFMTGPADDTDSGRPSVMRQVPSSGSSDWSGVDEVVLYTTEPMDPASIVAAFHVAESGVLVDGTLELLGDGRTIRFQTPTAFEVGALVQVYLESTATDESGNAVYDYDGHFSMAAAGGDGAGTRPWVTGSFPANGTDDVNALVPALTLRFSEPMDAGTTGGSVVLYDVDAGDAEVAVDISFDASSELMTVTPQAPLNAGGSYQLALTTELLDTDGDSLWYAYPIHFSLLPTAVDDDRQPMVVALSPAPGSTGVGVNARYSVRYDEPMNPTRFDTDGGERFNAQFSEDNEVLRYERTDTLDPETAYVEAVPTLGDYAGNPAVAAEASFETGVGLDLTRATEIANTISTTMPLAPVLGLQYSESLDPVSVSESGVGLYSLTEEAVVPTTASLQLDGTQLLLVPTEPLSPGHSYRVNTNALRDLSGNSVQSQYHSFTGGNAVDQTAPGILGSSVADGQLDVAINPVITIEFDEVVSRLTLAGITLVDSGAEPVELNVNFEETSVDLIPTTLLTAGETYTLTVEGVQDLSGNELETPFTVAFTTGPDAEVNRRAKSPGWKIAANQTEAPSVRIVPLKRVGPKPVRANSFYFYNQTAGRAVSGARVLSENGRTLSFARAATHQAWARYRWILYGAALDDGGDARNVGDRYVMTQ